MKRETTENVDELMNMLKPRNINDFIEGKEIKPYKDEILKISRNDSDQEFKRSSNDRRHRKGDDDRTRDHNRRRQDYSDDERENNHQSKRKGHDEDNYREERPRRRSRSPRERRRNNDYDRVISSRDFPLEPVLGEVYTGRVNNITKFGCFVEIYGLAKRCDGLVHISELSQERDNKVEDVVSRGQKVKVKVIGGGEKIKLSLKGIDQTTGEDLNPQGARIKETNFRNPDRPSNYDMANTRTLKKTNKKRMSSQERWEMQQMGASGHCIREEFDEYEEIDFDEEVINIEMTDIRPQFLARLSEDTTDMDPVSVILNPDGSLASAAKAQKAFLKERKDMKREEEKSRDNGSVSGFDRRLDDPMFSCKSTQPSANTRRQIEIPEWRKSLLSGSLGKKDQRSILKQRQSLPVFQLKNELLHAIAENQVLVVVGQTGSGKSTQITQYLAEAGYSQRGKIGCTQPRRVAATSVAKRVAEEYGCVLGEAVGYAIRFEDRTNESTVIKYMTDGILLKECLTDPNLKEYSVIMLDEAHERTVGTDVLFGLLKKAIQKRPDLKLIVTSATLNKQKFSEYFFGSPAFDIPGKTFEVDVYYTSEPEDDYIQSVVTNVMYLHLHEGDGDILVFLTGQEEIDTACESLYNQAKKLGQDNLIILPIYSALPSEVQSRVFEPTPPGSRKVVIATNIAETSLTIDGIVYVIDPGFVKQKVYDSKTDVDQLVVTPISQAQANQRKGRAGRTRKGKCYRLYTEQAFRTEMAENCTPEILRTDLTTTVLTMKAMGINDILEFDFMDRPSTVGLQLALKNLYDLGALDEQGLLTKLGRKMAEFPLEPRLSKALIKSSELKCGEEILTIVSMLSVDNVFYRPKEKEAEADKKRMRFTQTEGDHFTLLALYNAWIKNGRAPHWSKDNFIQQQTMKKADDIRKQLYGMMIKHNLSLESCDKNVESRKTVVNAQKAILSGFFQNVAKKDGKEGYKRMKDFQETFIHPSSCLMKSQPRYVIYDSLQLTSKEYMRQVMAIDPNWLIELAPNTFKHNDPTKLSKAQKEIRLEPLNLRRDEVWRLSKMYKKTGTKTTF